MEKNTVLMEKCKKIALVAHDNKKKDLLNWVKKNNEILKKHKFYATGTTGSIIQKNTDLEIIVLKSGPLGGDQQIGAKIVENDIDCLLFFWDPLESQPHDPDVKALLRIAALYNIPVATNQATADFIITSQFMADEYERNMNTFEVYYNRRIEI
ncbi:methylglyoxal synthase [Oceanirhabdus seepicola]|uniref:Methylglyoxal synthase n=1 Tax=Oceanirhabdus seepicola TaxID=2828781 RepID=A0A9J6P6W6_9CLOT|nr:methylglyoxal synthase [Oceanirhabdus seepicola]MCM1992610.1 methylglyoxal synthase [Oceanirhabdus seepicola]